MVDRLQADNMYCQLRVATVKVVCELRLGCSRTDDEDLGNRPQFSDDLLEKLLIKRSSTVATDTRLEVQLALHGMTVDDGRLSTEAGQVVAVRLNIGWCEQRKVHHGGVLVVDPDDCVLVFHGLAFHGTNLQLDGTPTPAATTTAKGPNQPTMTATGVTIANMARLVAFLGGINVGGHRVTMERLRAEFSELGLANVATFIASGNVLFDASGAVSGVEARLEEQLGQRMGWPVPAFVRKASEVREIVASKPFGVMPEGHTHMVALVKAAFDDQQRHSIEGHSTAHDRFVVCGREVHWAIDGKLTDSGITLPKLVKLIGRNTTRNITSMTRLVDQL